MLDLSLSDIADFLDPAPDQKWEIRFVRPKGNTRKELQWRTFLRVEVARAKKDKIDSAVADIVQETEGSRAQVFRDYRACKQCWEGFKSIVKELEEDEAQPLREIACASAEIINQVDLVIAGKAKGAMLFHLGSRFSSSLPNKLAEALMPKVDNSAALAAVNTPAPLIVAFEEMC